MRIFRRSRFMHMNKTKEKAELTTRKTTFNRTMKFMLLLFGIWPGRWGVIFSRLFWCLTLTVVQISQFRYFLAHLYSNDIFDLMDCFSAILGFSKFFIKLIVCWLNQRVLENMLKIITEDWSDCADSDVELRETASKARQSDFISNLIVTLHTVAVLFYGSTIILTTNIDLNDPTIEPPQIFKVEIPIELNTQYVYKSVLTIELIYLIMSSWGMGIVNALLIVLTLHAGGQIDILCHWLVNFVPADDRKRESNLSKIVQKHQKIIRFTASMETLFSFIALLQFVSNVMMICLLGFLIITALDNPNTTEKIFRSLSYYSVTSVEAFTFCYAGEYLINKSKAIGHAAFNSVWYEMEPRRSRALLIIILRSQKQLTLTIGKLMDLSLQRFTSIMNSAGSYISVLMAMQ